MEAFKSNRYINPMKRCPKCSLVKSVDDFYRNRAKDDGLQVWCKPCWKTMLADRKARDPDRVRRISRESYHRHKKPRSWPRKPYDLKEQARRRLQCQVAMGKIKRQPCAACGTPNADAHHHDYSKPLDVEWFCRLCHAAEHRRLNGVA